MKKINKLSELLNGRVSERPVKKPILIAEVGNSHEGSLGLAHSFIDAIKSAGADAVKFQTHIANAESTVDEKFRVAFSTQDKTRFNYWKRMEFSEEQWAELKEHADDVGLEFLSTPFSVEAADLLHRIGVNVWKVGSGELASSDLMDTLVAFKQPIIISTGMSDWNEINALYKFISENGSPLAILQCTTMYPTPIEKVGLNVINEIKNSFDTFTGLSDHSGSPVPAIAAAARGCDIIELHVTFDKRMFGPDQTSSLNFEEFSFVVRAVNEISAMDINPVNKDKQAKELLDLKRTFGKSVALKSFCSKGTILTEELLTLKKPGDGIKPNEAKKLLGLKLNKNVEANRLLSWTDVNEA
jgi:N-acetylneuraminate synthase